MKKLIIILLFTLGLFVFPEKRILAIEQDFFDSDRQEISFTMKNMNASVDRSSNIGKYLPQTNERQVLYMSLVGSLLIGFCGYWIFEKRRGWCRKR